MKKFLIPILKYKWYIVAVLLLAGGTYYFLGNQNTTAAEQASSFYVVETVERGDVSSGIKTTGEIVAAQKLDLNVYVQESRLEVVNVSNGSHVEAGDVLFTFDKSDAYVDIESSQVNVVEAELALNQEQENYTDPNTLIRTLENDIAELTTAINQAELDKVQAYRDYLNADLEAESGNTKTVDKTAPIISGLYTGTEEGEYLVSVYNSGASSGYSYTVSGLPGSTESVLFDFNTALGTDGLEIKFSSTAEVRGGDEWIVAVPNTYAPEYVVNLEDYEEAIVDLDEAIAGYQLDIANKQEQIEDLMLTDSTEYRDLNIAQAEASLSEAQVQLAQSYDVVQEQDIVAPFSGTVEGIENVVVGATPTRDVNDPINLGTLISDSFLVTFSLGAVEVADVTVGQKVNVSLTSFPEIPPLEASVTEISSLPSDDGVAQYEVLALLDYEAGTSSIEIREGMLAEIEVVQEERIDVVRIPTAAITYEANSPVVTVIDSLTEEQQAQVDRLGIVKTDVESLVTHTVPVTLGIQGLYFVEIIDGLSEGDFIQSTAIAGQSSVAETAQKSGGAGGAFGGGGGGGGGTRPQR